MEFHAYPSAVPAGRKDVRALLKLQNVLHSTDSIVLPATMLLLGSFIVAYQHCTHGDTSRTSARNFLIKILISMVPLAILEVRVPKCADPVGLFSRFSTKVMMMHAGFLALRFSSVLWDLEAHRPWFDTVMLLAACASLPTVFGLRPSLKDLREHRDVFLLMAVSVSLAAVEVYTFSRRYHSREQLAQDMVITSSDYIEIVAFVPAVWMAFRRDGVAAEEQDAAKISTSQKRALCLFAFMLTFYSMEDIGSALAVWRYHKIAAFGHTLHYLLLLDFAGFLLAHLCDPAKLQAMKGSFMSWMHIVCTV